jgi:hypothetical protein
VLIALTILVALLAAFMWIPLGSPTMSQGRVLSISWVGGRFGAYPQAAVALPERKVFVSKFVIYRCAVGDQIVVHGQRHIWGWEFIADAAPCRAGAGLGPMRVLTAH